MEFIKWNIQIIEGQIKEIILYFKSGFSDLGFWESWMFLVLYLEPSLLQLFQRLKLGETFGP